MNVRFVSGLFVFLLALPLYLAAQSLPLIPSSCRSEQDARLAFGLCPDQTFDFYASGAYRPDVPRPEAIFGYPIGSWHTTYGRMEQYLDTLSRAIPERVRVFDYGRSVEYHTMHLVAISSEQHIANLETIRTHIHRLADPETPPEEVEQLVRSTPAIVWLNAANDGNETAAFEAAIQLAYQIAAGEDERTRRIREHTVVLINLAHNPESHERMVAWYNAFVSGDPDPLALEHQPPWGMSTNNNHYQIDLNRDALGLTQTESRAVAAALHFWRPQVFVDLHGQTTQYFFPPAAIPINPVYPEQMNKWLEIYGRANAAAFDQFGWSYYTRDIFDLYYPGYWDTYPALNGAIGMTYETDGGGNKGIRWRRDDGTILTFADGIAHHFVAALTTAETTARYREERLRDYHAFFTSALEDARRDSIKAFLLPRNPDPRKTDQLVTTLLRHEVEVHQLLDPARIPATSFLSGETEERTFPAGTYVVYTYQKNYRIVRNLLAPDIPLPEAFKKQELRRMARNLRLPPGKQERYAFYDLTAWNLPMGMNVPAYWTSRQVRMQAQKIELPPGWKNMPADWTSETPFTLPITPRTKKARSAYVWRPDTEGALRLLARLLAEGFKVAVSERPLVVENQDFPRGTFIARVGRNPETLHERIRALARDAGVEVYAADTAFPERGPTGTGSESTRSLRPPRVGVLAGEGISPTSYGALWYFFERRLHYPFTALRVSRLARVDLTPFDVLILPHGSYRTLDSKAWDKLKAWVQAGGVLLGYAGGAQAILRARPGTSHEDLLPPPPPPDTVEAILQRIDALVGGPPPSPLKRSPEARPDAPIRVPGAFLRAYVDPEHWLTAGFTRRELPVLTQQLPLPLTRKGINAVVFAEGARLRLSGFVWPDNTRRNYAGRAYATVDEVGRGKVILLSEDPLFRIVFNGPSRLLVNGVFLGSRGFRSYNPY